MIVFFSLDSGSIEKNLKRRRGEKSKALMTCYLFVLPSVSNNHSSGVAEADQQRRRPYSRRLGSLSLLSSPSETMPFNEASTA